MPRSISLSFYVIGDVNGVRAKNLIKSLETLVKPHPLFVNAIFPGREGVLAQNSSFRTKVRLARSAVPGELGCSLSHKWAYEHFLSSGAERAVILEDDVLLAPDFSIETVLERAKTGIITLLGYHEPCPGPSVTRFPSTGTMAYTLDRPAAAKVLRLHLRERFRVSIPADWPVSMTLRFSHASPPLAYHPDRAESQSTIGKRQAQPIARLGSMIFSVLFPLDATLRLVRFVRSRKCMTTR